MTDTHGEPLDLFQEAEGLAAPDDYAPFRVEEAGSKRKTSAHAPASLEDHDPESNISRASEAPSVIEMATWRLAQEYAPAPDDPAPPWTAEAEELSRAGWNHEVLFAKRIWIHPSGSHGLYKSEEAAIGFERGEYPSDDHRRTANLHVRGGDPSEDAAGPGRGGEGPAEQQEHGPGLRLL